MPEPTHIFSINRTCASTLPTWSAVEVKMGDGSTRCAQPFRLLLEVPVDDGVMTILSSTTSREDSAMVET